MHQNDVKDLPLGLYKIFWRDGDEGSDGSVAAVGQLHDGTRWFAPTNWTAKCEHGIASTKWDMVSTIHPLSYDW